MAWRTNATCIRVRRPSGSRRRRRLNSCPRTRAWSTGWSVTNGRYYYVLFFFLNSHENYGTHGENRSYHGSYRPLRGTERFSKIRFFRKKSRPSRRSRTTDSRVKCLFSVWPLWLALRCTVTLANSLVQIVPQRQLEIRAIPTEMSYCTHWRLLGNSSPIQNNAHVEESPSGKRVFPKKWHFQKPKSYRESSYLNRQH